MSMLQCDSTCWTTFEGRGGGRRGVIDITFVARRSKEEEYHCEIPTTWRGHKNKKIGFERGTTSGGPKKEIIVKYQYNRRAIGGRRSILKDEQHQEARRGIRLFWKMQQHQEG
jgi:hypothetical protein